MSRNASFEAALTGLKLKFETEALDDATRYEITLDDSEGLTIQAIVYEEEHSGAAVRFISYVDELDSENQQEQYELLLELNSAVPTGAFSIDPQEGTAFFTVNLPLDNIQQDHLEWMIEYMLSMQEMYMMEYYETEGEAEEQS